MLVLTLQLHEGKCSLDFTDNCICNKQLGIKTNTLCWMYDLIYALFLAGVESSSPVSDQF